MRALKVGVATAVLVAAGQLQAAVITAASASTNMGSGSGTSLNNTINGAGLSSFPSLTATHGPTSPSNSWVSGVAITGNIDFNLGGSFLVDGFSFWNQNAGGPGVAGSTGIQNVVVLSSVDGSTFTSIAGAPSIFSQVTGSSILPPEIFSFTPITASHIRFQVGSNYGDSEQTGFAEVAFSGSPAASSPVPEPSTFALLGIGAVCLIGYGRRRKRKAE